MGFSGRDPQWKSREVAPEGGPNPYRGVLDRQHLCRCRHPCGRRRILVGRAKARECGLHRGMGEKGPGPRSSSWGQPRYGHTAVPGTRRGARRGRRPRADPGNTEHGLPEYHGARDRFPGSAYRSIHAGFRLDGDPGRVSISLRYSVKQEALLLVIGSVKETGNSFCQNSPWYSLQWVKQARKIFALEVWSAGAVAGMQTRIKPAPNAPDGVYICNIQSPEGNKIALYGILPEVVSDSNARAKVFPYLRGQASSFLRP